MTAFDRPIAEAQLLPQITDHYFDVISKYIDQFSFLRTLPVVELALHAAAEHELSRVFVAASPGQQEGNGRLEMLVRAYRELGAIWPGMRAIGEALARRVDETRALRGMASTSFAGASYASPSQQVARAPQRSPIGRPSTLDGQQSVGGEGSIALSVGDTPGAGSSTAQGAATLGGSGTTPTAAPTSVGTGLTPGGIVDLHDSFDFTSWDQSHLLVSLGLVADPGDLNTGSAASSFGTSAWADFAQPQVPASLPPPAASSSNVRGDPASGRSAAAPSLAFAQPQHLAATSNDPTIALSSPAGNSGVLSQLGLPPQSLVGASQQQQPSQSGASTPSGMLSTDLLSRWLDRGNFNFPLE